MDAIRSTGGSLTGYIRNIIGTYTPLQDQSTGEFITTSAGIDWEYIVTSILFILIVYFMLKFLTLIFKR